MDKIWTIAVREYRAIVGAKAFMIALVLMPVLMFAGFAVQSYLKGRVGPEMRRIVVLDGTGRLLPTIEQAAKARNGQQGDMTRPSRASPASSRGWKSRPVPKAP